MKPLSAAIALVCLVVSWYYVALYWSASDRGIPVEFYPTWNASRAVLHHINPYSQDITEQNQIAAYGAAAASVGLENEQRFAYPVYAMLPLLPLALLPFTAANSILFIVYAVLTVLAVGWLRDRLDWTTVLYCAVVFSCYPIIYDLRSRQPSLLFFAFAVAGLRAIQLESLGLAGLLAALSLGKPHLALSVILTELIWAVTKWGDRKRFAISFFGAFAGLLLLSWLLSPGWIRS